MNTIGQILKESRTSQGIDLSDLEKTTKIKKDFILKIEKEDWNNLPEFTVVSGFVKNIANALDLSVDNISAVLRRDYPPKKLMVSPKPDVQNKFVWSPKLTFAVGVSTLILFVLGYLGFQYKKFIEPPELIINNPKVNEVVLKESIKVTGKTTTDAVVTVNNQPITLDQDGKFSSEIEVTKDTKELFFKAISRSGKVTEKVVKISVE